MAPARSDDRLLGARARCGDRVRALLLLATAAAAHFAATGVHGVKLMTSEGATNGQLVMVEEQPLELVCEGEKQPEIAYPTFPGTRPEMKIHRFPADKGGHRFNFTLRVARALRQHTGYYNCSADGDPVTDSIYVYVRSADGQNPWVKDADTLAGEEMMGLYGALINETATLDCRPNDPTTKVHLVDKTGKTMSLGKQPDGSELTWEPRIGFRLGPVTMEHSGTYKCVVDEHHPELKLKLLAVASWLVEPTVRLDQSLPYATLGGNVNLTCELATAKSLDFELQWFTPSGEDATYFLSESNFYELFSSTNASHSWHRRARTLILTSVQAKDGGKYVCTARDEHGDKRSAVLNVVVKSPDGAVQKYDHQYNNTTAFYGVSGNQGLRCAFNAFFTSLLSFAVTFLLRY